MAQSDPPPVVLSVGDIRSQIAAEWLEIAQRSQWRAYRKPPSLFRMAPSLSPYALPFPKMGFHIPPRYANGHISATSDPIHFMFGFRVGFSGSPAIEWRYFGLYRIQDGGQLPSWKIYYDRISAKGHAIHFMLRFYGMVFRALILYGTHRTVIFAIAQLSCYITFHRCTI